LNPSWFEPPWIDPVVCPTLHLTILAAEANRPVAVHVYTGSSVEMGGGAARSVARLESTARTPTAL
jgi:hypothetical protein